MSIKSEIDRITGNIASAYAAVGEKGVELPELRNSENLAEAVAKIQTGGVGKSVEGQVLYPTPDSPVTAGEGAEIFNDYSERTFAGNIARSGNVAVGQFSHAEGFAATAMDYAHAEGFCTKAGNFSAHAEGTQTVAGGMSSHAEGDSTTASGYFAHAEGAHTTASGMGAHAEGLFTTAKNDCSHAGGMLNKDMVSGDIFVLGYGTAGAEKNIFRVTDAGAVYGLRAFNSTGADYAEYFEWQDGNPDKEDRAGRFVTLDGEKVRLAGSGDEFILGIVSGNPSVIGDAYEDHWIGQYETDIFGRPINEELTIPAEQDKAGRVIIPERIETHQKLTSDYDNTQEYIRRSDRPEWTAVGMMGKLVVEDDGTCEVNGWCTTGAAGAATASESRTRYRVMSRLDANHIRVLIL